MISLPKILVAGPTHKVKDYCFIDWINNVKKFDYPNFNILLADNTEDDGLYAQHLNNTYNQTFGNDFRFKAINVFKENNISPKEAKKMGVWERLCISHTFCSDYVFKNNYSHLLHLESDIFPEQDVIEKLLFQNKMVIGSVYYTGSGSFRHPMVSIEVQNAPDNFSFVLLDQGQMLTFFDGTIKKVSAMGLGCVLINRFVLKKIPFRFLKNYDMAPDGFFSEDCHRNRINIYAHTGCLSRHENQQWGIFRIDYK